MQKFALILAGQFDTASNATTKQENDHESDPTKFKLFTIINAILMTDYLPKFSGKKQRLNFTKSFFFELRDFHAFLRAQISRAFLLQ